MRLASSAYCASRDLPHRPRVDVDRPDRSSSAPSFPSATSTTTRAGRSSRYAVKLGVAEPCTVTTVLPPSARAVTLVTTFSAALRHPGERAAPSPSRRELTPPHDGSFRSPVRMPSLRPTFSPACSSTTRSTGFGLAAAAESSSIWKNTAVGRHARHQRVGLRDVIAAHDRDAHARSDRRTSPSAACPSPPTMAISLSSSSANFSSRILCCG